MNVDVALVPAETEHVSPLGKSVVIVDVLRASTSIITAVASGCEKVLPVAEVEEARELSKSFRADKILLCGERGGRKILGFSLGNSPQEYTENAVRGCTLVFTSTNGSRLFQISEGAAAVYVGSLVNVTAVVSRLLRSNADVLILCAGREGRFSLEDAFCAGMTIDGLRSASKRTLVLADTAMTALVVFEWGGSDPLDVLRNCEHGRYLTSIGFEKDLPICAAIDSFSTVPVYSDGVIRK